MKHQGTLRLALTFAAFLGSLNMVIWRQSRALDVLKELDAARNSRAAVESEKSQLTGRIQQLESRARIMAVAESWWGMRVPTSDEEFVIMIRPDGTELPDRARLRMAKAGVFDGIADLLIDPWRD